jgi:hypothetical protein
MGAEAAFQETGFQKDAFQVEIGSGTIIVVAPKFILVDGNPAIWISGIYYTEL